MGLDVNYGATANFGNVTALAQDPTRDVVYMATSTGYVFAWNETTRSFVSTINVGAPLSSIDVSSDGKSLVVGESSTSGGTYPYFGTSAIDVISLGTSAIQHLPLTLTSYEGGVTSVAFTGTDDILFTTLFEGSGWTPFHFAAAGSSSLGSATVNGLSSVTGGTYLIASEDHRYVLVMEDNISDGPLHVYDTQAGKVTASTDLYALGSSGFNSGKGDINDSAGLVVDDTYNNIYVFNTSLSLVKDLSSLQQAGKIVGVHFDLGGHQLLLWDSSASQIVVYDTQTWQQVGTVPVTAHVGSTYNGDSTGLMSLSADGRYLTLDTGNGFESIDLKAALSLHITGQGSGHAVYGSVGTDVMTGGPGANAFYGIGGTDTVVFQSNYRNYAITPQSDGSLTVTSPIAGEGPDTLTKIQFLQFADVTAQVTAKGTLVVDTTAAAAASIAAAGGSDFAGVTVIDQAANVGANLDALQSVASAGKLASVALTDSGTPTVTLSATQLASDSLALNDISGPYGLAVTGVTAANAEDVAGQAHVTSVSVIDSAADIAANILPLEGLVAQGKLASIVLTDSGTPTLTLSAADLAVSTPVLAAITAPYNLAVTGVAADKATTVAAQAHVTLVSVSDSVYDVVANLDALQGLATTGELAAISLTDGGVPTISITGAKALADAAALSDISGTCQLVVSVATATDAISLASLKHVTAINIADTAADVAASLDSLEALATAGKLSSITLTDSGTPTLTVSAAQLAQDRAAIGDISGTYHLTVTGVSSPIANFLANEDPTRVHGGTAYNMDVAGISGQSDTNSVVGFQTASLPAGAKNAVVLAGGQSQYSLSFDAGGGLTVTANTATADATASQSVHITNASYVVFDNAATTDGIYQQMMVIAPNRGDYIVATLYQGSFGRLPDLPGLEAWQHQYDSGAMALNQIAQSFVGSSEFVQRYGAIASLSDQQYVTDLYANVLGRAPDQSGLSAWTTYLAGQEAAAGNTAAGNLAARATVLLDFCNSVEEITHASSWLTSGVIAQPSVAHDVALVGVAPATQAAEVL